MKIICSKNELFNGLNIVSKAVPQRTPMTVMDCILIEASDGIITLYATDNEIGIETTIKGNVEVSGKIALNAKMLTEFIRSLRSDDIVIESDDNLKTKIYYVGSNKPIFDNIMGKAGEEFNMIPETENNSDIKISQYTLKEMISKTIFSVSDSDNNRIITGELFEIKDNRLRVISMDGRRISIRITELKENTEDKKIIIPSKALSEINKILSGSMEDIVDIIINPKYAIFVFNDTRVYTTLLQGEFFNVDQMLSTDYNTKITVNRQNLLETVSRANLLVRESDNRPTIFNITSNNMQITINTQIAKFDEDVEVIKEGEDLMIGFNPKFIIETLKAIDDENVDMYFDGKISPVFVRNNEESYIYLVLPINIMNDNY